MRLSQRRGAFFEAAKSAGYGNFPNALLPAVRRGRRIFGRFRTARKRGSTEFGPETGLWRRVASRFGFCLWSFGSLLFDNCIGRKRDVGGGVLAGLRLSG